MLKEFFIKNRFNLFKIYRKKNFIHKLRKKRKII